MNEIEKRKEAILLYLSKEMPTAISRKLERSRAWFYKWLKRYKKNSKGSWYEEDRRIPITSKKKSQPRQRIKLYQ